MLQRANGVLIGLTVCLWAHAAGAQGEVSPLRISFTDSFARQQVLIEVEGVDRTTEAKYSVADPAVAAVDTTGYVRPVGPGQTLLEITVDGQRHRVPVEVAPYDAARRVDFQLEIEPILNRHGCNSGGCHGKASGQNGFRLSLFGFDTEFDYRAIVLEARGRRIFPAAPERSLLLTKGAAEVPHGGGRRLDPQGESYQTLRRWIAQGMPRTAPDAPRVTHIVIEPAARSLRSNSLQQLRVVAHYSDGSQRDVTRQAQYASNLDVVAAVSETGLVQTGDDSGEAAIMARYMGQVAVFNAMVPHVAPADAPAAPPFVPVNDIDRLVMAKWERLGLKASPGADDGVFLRRVTVDLCGRLPTVDEARAFLADNAADKRAQLIERLLASSDHATYFAMRWGTILRNSNLAGADRAAYAFHNWLKEMVANNRPYDEMVRGVVAASGEWQDAPAINWYWQMRDDLLHQVTADTAQVFLGTRLQCARCHHHPYERWAQDDYYGLAGFFTRLGGKSFGEPPPYFTAPTVTRGEKDPRTDKSPEPKYLDGEAPQFTSEDDPRHALVDWMVQPDNPFFAKTLVNRLWGHFFGRGLVDAVDDMRATNPPSNPELLDALAKDFVAHKFDVRRIIRQMLNSRVYQLSAEPTPWNHSDRQNYARFYGRRMIAEVVADSVDQVCGTRTAYNGVAASARSIDLPHENFGSYFLDTFDRPKRVSGCECERSMGSTIGQVLLMANSDEVENKIADGNGRIAQAIKAKRDPQQIIEELYLAAYCRMPTDLEQQKAAAYVGNSENQQQALEDVLWALLNTREFLFNH